ncbi:SDR family oxidoreductase [Halanaerocella petrolearia]
MGDRLDGKIALVTGGSRGLGRRICQALAQEGAKVVVNYAHSVDDAQKTVDLIKDKGGEATAIRADITDQDEIDKLVSKVKEVYDDRVDILVNNATGPQPQASLEEMTWEMYMDQIKFFVKAPLLLVKAVLPGMKEKGAGQIINIGSDVVQSGETNFSNYVTAKSAMIGMTRSWANELGPEGIRVNLVSPGFTPVERHADTSQDSIERYKEQVPLGRMGQPEDIANAVLFLASDESSYINGQELTVNGGKSFGV